MDESCFFCAICSGDHPHADRIVYEDAHTAAFIDIRQPAEGHTLVVPKKHVRTIYDLADEDAGPLMRAVAKMSRAVRDAFACEGMSHWISTEVAGGQEIFHLHVHIMPRTTGDGLLRKYPSPPRTPDHDELARQAAMLRRTLETPG